MSSTVERTTTVDYEVSIGYDKGEVFGSLKEARIRYKEMKPDEFDGVFLTKRTVETTVITTHETVQSK